MGSQLLGTETPLVSKAFKLVSFAILVAIIAITLSAAFSGYEEYTALTTVVSGVQSQNQLNAKLYGSTLRISGLDVPNKMSYPLSLEMLGNVTINSAQIGKFDSGVFVIPPGASQNISVSFGLNFSRLLSNARSFQSVLFNSSILSINSTIAARMVPLLGINISKAANSTLGPAMSNLATQIESSMSTVSSDGQAIVVPIAFTWINESPIAAGLWLNTTLIQIPGKMVGSYGGGSGPLSLVVGQNNATILVRIPADELSGGSLQPGTYTFQLRFSQSPFSHSIAGITQSVNV